MGRSNIIQSFIALYIPSSKCDRDEYHHVSPHAGMGVEQHSRGKSSQLTGQTFIWHSRHVDYLELH